VTAGGYGARTADTGPGPVHRDVDTPTHRLPVGRIVPTTFFFADDNRKMAGSLRHYIFSLRYL
jgi:hypothetical protein